MAERINRFIQQATVQQLKEKLSELRQSSGGNKNELRLRLQEAIQNLSETEIEVYFPKNRFDEGDQDNGGTEHTSTVLHSDGETRENSPESVDNLDQQINELREIVRKKEEIAELKKKLDVLRLEDDNVSSGAICNFRDVEESLPTFSGDDNLSIQKWIKSFEDSKEIFGWDEKRSFIYAQRLLRGTAKLFLRSASCRSWNQLKAALVNEFHQHVTAAGIHDTLRLRRKNRDETLQQYVLAMQEIAALSDIMEQDLIHYIVRGIQDSAVNKQLLYNANTISELKQVLRKYERMKMYSNLESSSRLPASHQKNGHLQQQNQRQQYPQKKAKCFNCNDHGHISNNCPKPKRQKFSCFRCGQQGHIATNCNQQGAIMMVQDESANTEEMSRNHESSNYEFIDNANDFHFLLSYTFCSPVTTEATTTTIKAMTVLDTGSPISFIKESYIPRYLLSTMNPASTGGYYGINNSELKILGKTYCSVEFRGNSVQIFLLIVEDNSMRYPIVLGRDFLKASKINFVIDRNFNTDDKDVGVDVLSKNIINTDVNSDREDIVLQTQSSTDDEFLKNILNIDPYINDSIEQNTCINENLGFEERELLKAVLKMYPTNDDYDFNENSNHELKIILTKNVVFNCTPRRLPFAHKIELQKILHDLLQKNIIRESSSPFASPIVLTKKKNSELRLCIDFRELNKVTQKDNYPLPLIEDQLDRLRGKRYFSLLDLKHGFHHVKVSEDSVKYTSFVTPLGQYEYLRMPFGLKNAPAVFQRYINSIFKKLIDQGKVLIYIDDLLIASETVNEHIDNLKEVMRVVKDNKLKLRFDKCKFMLEEITYLGYEVSSRGIGPNIDGLKAVKEFPIPKNIKDVQSFLGLCSYFRKFIREFAIVSKPLYDLLKKDSVFNFGPIELETFQNLKATLQKSPVLSIYNPQAETELHCDASSLGFGAVLLQKQEDNKFHPVFFFSKRTTCQEATYHSYELETLAIIYALRRFRIYLIGVKFKIVTDCKALTLTLNEKLLNPRISRWALELQDFDYFIEHRGSEKMFHVDALSRCHNILLVESDSFEHALASAQHKDQKIKDLVKMLEQRESPSFEMINGLVYRKLKGKVYFYVPSQMERNVIQTHHDALCHVGVEKCYDYLKQTYWFPGMKMKIKNYISNCLKCIHFSPLSGKKEGELHNIPKGSKPFEVIHIDHYGPLPPSVHNKQRYVFLVVDGFTKYTKLYPVRNTSTLEVLKCLRTYFSAYSKPRKVISDRGSCFTSDDFAKFCSENLIQHIKIATGSPQSNGQVERVNRSLTPMLSKESEVDPGEWSRYLSKVEFAMNNTINRSIGTTASMLLFGVGQKGEVSDKIREYLEDNILPTKSRDIDLIRERASENIRRSQDVNKAQFDKVHKPPHKYKVGDHVMIKNVNNLPGINKKLLPKYKGPYEIVKILPNDRYLVRDLENLQLSRVPYKGVASPENMRPYLNSDN